MAEEFDLSRLQDIQREILREFDALCRKKGWRYFLLGGSALGAVRHGGMIPWDDDIDVGMPAPIISAFCGKLPASCPPFVRTGLAFRTGLPDQLCQDPGRRSLFREEIPAALPIHHGVFIDVFPLDGAPFELSQVRRTLRRMKVLKFGIINRKTDYFRKKSHPASWYLSLRDRLAGGDAAYEKIDRLAQRYLYGAAPRIANWHGAWAEKEAVPTEMFGEGVRLPFDGLECPVPADYDGYLTCLYGDYRQLPAAGKADQSS